jgi:hypothetical protein
MALDDAKWDARQMIFAVVTFGVAGAGPSSLSHNAPLSCGEARDRLRYHSYDRVDQLRSWRTQDDHWNQRQNR